MPTSRLLRRRMQADAIVASVPASGGAVAALVVEQPLPHVAIRSEGLPALDVRELWSYRQLLGFLVWRNLKVRYKQTVLGASWAVLQPVLSMVIFSVVFGGFAKIPSEGLPYPVFSFAGLLPWTYFASCLGSSSSSIVGNSNLVTKVYVPRLILPLATVVAPLVDLLLAFTVLLGIMAWYGIAPSWHAVALPGFLLLALAIALGVGLLLAPLNVKYRDILYAVPFLVQIWMWATPIVYPPSIVPAGWRWLLALNPMAGVVEGFRWAVLGHGGPSPAALASSVGVALVLLLVGVATFRRGESSFADVI